MEFLKLLLSGKKKMFQNKEVNRIVIPNWSEFRFEALYNQAVRFPDVLIYLPDDGLRRRFDKQFLANVRLCLKLLQILNTVNPQFFPRNLELARTARQEQKAIEADEIIEMDQTMLMFVEACPYFSTRKLCQGIFL